MNYMSNIDRCIDQWGIEAFFVVEKWTINSLKRGFDLDLIGVRASKTPGCMPITPLILLLNLKKKTYLTHISNNIRFSLLLLLLFLLVGASPTTISFRMIFTCKSNKKMMIRIRIHHD